MGRVGKFFDENDEIWNFLIVLAFMIIPEYFFNVVTFWMRPIYRRVIKIEKWRKFIFKIGRKLISKITMFCFYAPRYLVFQGVSIICLLGVGCFIDFGVYRVLCGAFISFFCSFGNLGFLLSDKNSSFLEPIFLDENGNFCLWSDSLKSFFKYYDGYFRKEKLVYKAYQRSGKEVL